MKIRTIGQDNDIIVLTLCDGVELVVLDGECIAATVEGERLRTDNNSQAIEGMLPWVNYADEPTKSQSFFDTLLKEVTITSQSPGRLFFTDDGTKALIIGEDGNVVHEYLLDEAGIPIHENV